MKSAWNGANLVGADKQKQTGGYKEDARYDEGQRGAAGVDNRLPGGHALLPERHVYPSSRHENTQKHEIRNITHEVQHFRNPKSYCKSAVFIVPSLVLSHLLEIGAQL